MARFVKLKFTRLEGFEPKWVETGDEVFINPDAVVQVSKRTERVTTLIMVGRSELTVVGTVSEILAQLA